MEVYGRDLYIAPLAVIEEMPDPFSVLHDGPHKAKRNQHIEIRGQIALPMVDDDKALMAREKEVFGSQTSLFAFVFDVTNAHRRVWLRESDWGKTTLGILNVPLKWPKCKWPKCRGGFEVECFGNWYDYKKFGVGLSEKRLNWII